MKTRAAVVFKVNEPFQVETLDLQSPQTNEVLVRMQAAGVCHSDWHILNGHTKHPLPVALGHEGAGVVEEVGPGVTHLKPGDHVSLNWAPSCGHCFYCLEDRPGLCKHYLQPIWAGTMLDGTTRLSLNGKPIFHYSSLACFAEYAVVPDVCCVPLDRDVPWDVAALIGCAVTTGAGAVLRTANVRPGSSVAVYGCGGVGLSAVLASKLAGADPIFAVDTAQEKEAIAKACGATAYLRADGQAFEHIRAATDGRGADYVFEAIGIPEVQTECLEATRPGGTLVLAGITPMGVPTPLFGDRITRQEKSILGSYYGSSRPARDFPLFASMFLAGTLPLDRMVSKTYTLDEVNEAFGDMLAGRVGRGVLRF